MRVQASMSVYSAMIHFLSMSYQPDPACIRTDVSGSTCKCADPNKHMNIYLYISGHKQFPTYNFLVR